jgi:hypothetical protein
MNFGESEYSFGATSIEINLVFANLLETLERAIALPESFS